MSPGSSTVFLFLIFRIKYREPFAVNLASQSLRCSLVVVSVAALAGQVGCDDQGTAPVSGKITCEGKEVPEGTITFYPKAGGRPGTSEIQPDGTYVLSTLKPGDGAPMGEYDVTIEAKRVTGGGANYSTLEEEVNSPPQVTAPAEIEWLVPIEYTSVETSGLTATVESGENVIDFDLP